MRLLMEEFEDSMKQLAESGAAAAWNGKTRRISTVTGYLPYPYIKRMADRMCETFPGLSVTVYPIRNDFFGPQITVAGLVTATDIIAQLKGQSLPRRLLIPKVMLRFEGDMFLDSIPVKKVEKALKVKITAVPNDGYCLLERMTER